MDIQRLHWSFSSFVSRLKTTAECGGCSLGSRTGRASEVFSRMPRITPRKGFFYVVGFSSFLLLVVNVHQRELLARSVIQQLGQEQGSSTSHKAEQEEHGNTHNSEESSDYGKETERSGLRLQSGGMRRHDTLDKGKLTLKKKSKTDDRPWYMRKGTLRPQPAAKDITTNRRIAKLWPVEALGEDRIPNQLMYVPPHDELPTASEYEDVPLKKILLYNGMSSWAPIRPGRGIFLKNKCPVDTCVLTSNRAEAATSDVIIFKDHFSFPNHRRPPHQAWMLYLLECPLHTQHFKYKDVFNWTATYRRDSDIVAPYEKWQYYDENVTSIVGNYNFAANKTRKVAWFVSNCGARNNRLQYAHELQKYISVDIYGACGTKKCSRSNSAKCFEMLDNDYKFYLAFENSNCKDYITEKFFVNGLGHKVLPIVMGARSEDYAKSAPHKSYIHVDDFDSPKELAEHLHKLDQNDDLYNEYFHWKGTGEFINTYFMCRLCSVAHDQAPSKYYHDINEWWRGPGTCISGSWRKYQKLQQEQGKMIGKKKDK